MSKSKKQPQKLHKKSKECQIYGIFDKQNKKLLYISLDKDQIDLEFELGDYDDSNFELITFNVLFN